ncbi:MAG: hypothetical protein R3F60_08995 [bacterium]
MRPVLLPVALGLSAVGCQASWPGGPWGLVALALAFLTFLGFARGQQASDASVDAGVDAGPDQGPGAEPEYQVCLCAAFDEAADPPMDAPATAAALDAAAVRDRVLARLPADVVNRLRPPTA